RCREALGLTLISRRPFPERRRNIGPIRQRQVWAIYDGALHVCKIAIRCQRGVGLTAPVVLDQPRDLGIYRARPSIPNLVGDHDTGVFKRLRWLKSVKPGFVPSSPYFPVAV